MSKHFAPRSAWLASALSVLALASFGAPGCAGSSRRSDQGAGHSINQSIDHFIEPSREQLAAKTQAAPSDGGAWRDLGWSDLLDGDHERAAVELAKARALSPSDARTLMGLATLAEEAGRYDEARTLWLDLIDEHAQARPGDPWAAAILDVAAARVQWLAGETPGGQELGQRLERIDLARLPAEARSRLLATRATLLRQQGEEQAAARLDAERGCPSSVRVEGPFGHLPRLDLARSFAPDRGGALGDTKDDAGRTVSARACRFAVAMPQGSPGVAYSVFWLEAPRRGLATAQVEVGDGAEPWHLLVDGVTVWREDSEDRFPPSRRSIDLRLAPGWHRVALKLAAPEPRTDVGLRIDFVTDDGARSPLRWSAQPPSVKHLATAPEPGRVHPSPIVPAQAGREAPRLADYLAALAAAHAGDHDAGLELAARLETSAPHFAPGWLLSAAIASDDPSRPQNIARDRARQRLERALAVDSGCLAARYELAQMDLADDHADRALERLAAVPMDTASSDSKSETKALTAKWWRMPFARYLALRKRGWTVEAEQALRAARQANPEACPPLVGEVDVALDRRDPKRARAAAEALVRCEPTSEKLAQLLVDQGVAPAAVAEYRRLLVLDPSRAMWRFALARSLMADGDAKGAAVELRTLVRDDPRASEYRRRLADALLALGDEQGARQTLLDGLAYTPESATLRQALEALGEPDPLAAFRLDGREVIADFERAGRGYDTPAVIVLDRTVMRVFPTGARLTLTHNIMRVQTKDGIDRFGEVDIPSGADVLLLRAVKADGSTREPESIAGKSSISVPDLEPGDYVEFEYVEANSPPPAFPGGFYSDRFYFQSFDAPLDRTEFVVVTPPTMPLQIDARGPAPTVSEAERDVPHGDRIVVRTWSDHHKEQLRPEPEAAPFTEYVPSVRVASRVDFAGWRDFLRDRRFGVFRANHELTELARQLKTPERIDDWVRRHVEDGGSPDDTASAVLARGQGSRALLEQGLLRAAGRHVSTWLVRPRGMAVLDGPLPDLEGYGEPVLALYDDQGGLPRVLDPRFRHSPTGSVAPPLRGMSALPIDPVEGEQPASDAKTLLATVPDVSVPPDGRDIHLEATLAADGSAEVTVRERLSGWPALSWREGLDRLDESHVRSQFEQQTLGYYFPGATLTDLRYAPRDDDDQPLTIEYRFHAPRFAAASGKQLVLSAPFPQLLGQRYVGVAERKTPLELDYAAPITVDEIVHLPAGATVSTPPAIDTGGNQAALGSFTQSVTASDGALHLRSRFAMPSAIVPPARYGELVRDAHTVDQAQDVAATVTLP